jgi:hypothetical protein
MSDSFLFFLFVLLCIFPAATSVSSSTHSDTTFAFRIEIEPQWKLAYEVKDTGLYYLRDETKQKKAEFDLRKIKVDTISILAESEYAKIFFLSSLTIAHKLGTVMNWDSTPSLSVGNLRAYDLFAHYKSIKNGVTKWYVEYARWCSQDSFLYELTIISDDLDEFKNNKQYYMGMLNSIQVWAPGHAPVTSDHNKTQTFILKKTGNENEAAFDISGRKLSPILLSRRCNASQCEISNKKIILRFSGGRNIILN